MSVLLTGESWPSCILKEVIHLYDKPYIKGKYNKIMIIVKPKEVVVVI